MERDVSDKKLQILLVETARWMRRCCRKNILLEGASEGLRHPDTIGVGAFKQDVLLQQRRIQRAVFDQQYLKFFVRHVAFHGTPEIFDCRLPAGTDKSKITNHIINPYFNPWRQGHHESQNAQRI